MIDPRFSTFHDFYHAFLLSVAQDEGVYDRSVVNTEAPGDGGDDVPADKEDEVTTPADEENEEDEVTMPADEENEGDDATMPVDENDDEEVDTKKEVSGEDQQGRTESERPQNHIYYNAATMFFITTSVDVVDL